MTKLKVTYTIDVINSKYVEGTAHERFDDNESMAIRKIISEHSKVPKEMWGEILK